MFLNILAGARSYEAQIWWEIPPWAIGVFLVKNQADTRPAGPGVEGKWEPRASQRVRFEESRGMHSGQREPPNVAQKDKAKRKVDAGGLTMQSKIEDVPKMGHYSG